MASRAPTLRPLSCWKSLVRYSQKQEVATRLLSTYRQPKPASTIPFEAPMTPIEVPHVNRKIKTFPPPPSPAAKFKDPISDLHSEQIKLLDPTGARTSLFNKLNPEGAKVGDILQVRQKNGDPFAGVCINIRRRGVDTGILLRNELTRVGVEMWYKVYSPLVEGIEVVKRAEKRARRARLTYYRKPKHDMRSVQNIVLQYSRQGSSLKGRSVRKNKGKK